MVILRGEFVHTLHFTPICNQFTSIYQIRERPYLEWGENEWAAILIGEKMIITWGENDWGENVNATMNVFIITTTSTTTGEPEQGFLIGYFVANFAD